MLQCYTVTCYKKNIKQKQNNSKKIYVLQHVTTLLHHCYNTVTTQYYAHNFLIWCPHKLRLRGKWLHDSKGWGYGDFKKKSKKFKKIFVINVTTCVYKMLQCYTVTCYKTVL